MQNETAWGPNNERRDAWMGIKRKYVPQLKIFVLLQPNPLSNGAPARSAPSWSRHASPSLHFRASHRNDWEYPVATRHIWRLLWLGLARNPRHRHRNSAAFLMCQMSTVFSWSLSEVVANAQGSLLSDWRHIPPPDPTVTGIATIWRHNLWAFELWVLWEKMVAPKCCRRIVWAG